MKVISLRLQGLKKVIPSVFPDARGFFLESYRAPLYQSHGIDCTFVQDNLSFSKQGTIRALHFQSDPGQAKLVSCIQGKIWDVAVDLRPSSSTFGQWEAVELNSEEHHQLFIPVGFAHGFCVLSETAQVLYKVSSIYDPKVEKSIRWNDPTLGIKWPISSPLLSSRDETSPFLKEVLL
jgi:dTDP-4-dehydrorhamnose 3,5-epimerase